MLAFVTKTSISYEDPRWTKQEVSLMAGGADPSWYGARPESDRRAFSPEGAPFLEYVHHMADEPRQALDALLATASSQGFPGDFVVRETPAGLAVVPRDGSPFDTRISIDEAERTPAESMKVILDELKESGGPAVKVYVAFRGDTPVRTGARDQPVRDVLAHVTSANPHPIIWSLLYHPRSGYTLQWGIMMRPRMVLQP